MDLGFGVHRVDPLMDFDEYKTLEYNSLYIDNLREHFRCITKNIVKYCEGMFPYFSRIYWRFFWDEENGSGAAETSPVCSRDVSGTQRRSWDVWRRPQHLPRRLAGSESTPGFPESTLSETAERPISRDARESSSKDAEPTLSGIPEDLLFRWENVGAVSDIAESSPRIKHKNPETSPEACEPTFSEKIEK